MTDINKSLALDDKNIVSYFFRAGLFTKKLEYDKAIKDFDEIIRLEPNNGKAYDHRGYAKFQMGDKSGGCIDLKKARELGFIVGNKESDKLICK
jgi:tetratricopeptide (TPR) repeat protein